MQFEEMVVAIVAMSLGFALMKHLITAIWGSPGERRRERKRHRKAPAATMSMEEQETLISRAEDLLRRIETLEEIVSSDPARGEIPDPVTKREKPADIYSVH